MTELSRICIVGAGAIGSLLAGHLGQVADVSILVRRDEQAEALNRDGLTVSGKSQLHTRVQAAVEPGELEPVDLCIVAAKAPQLSAVAANLREHFEGATLMTIQNGLGAEELMTRAGSWPVISAVTFMSGIRHSDTHVEYELDTETWTGPFNKAPSPQRTIEAVTALLVRSGLRARSFTDLRPAQWSKLIFNSAVNGVAALTELPHVAAFATARDIDDLGHVVRGLMDEGKQVADAAGVQLHQDPWDMNIAAVLRGSTTAAEGDYAHLPSMLGDVLARRPTEVDFICGVLVREGERHGVPTPLTSAIWRLIKAKESSWKSVAVNHAEEV